MHVNDEFEDVVVTYLRQNPGLIPFGKKTTTKYTSSYICALSGI
jgi:hypothetical protein